MPIRDGSEDSSPWVRGAGGLELLAPTAPHGEGLGADDARGGGGAVRPRIWLCL